LGYDKANMTNNKYGIANLRMTIDGKEIFSHKIDRMHFDNSRKILIHTDYEISQKTGRRFEKLYVDDGNDINIYSSLNNGKFSINDSSTHAVQISMADVYGNQRVVNFKIKGEQNPAFKILSKNNSTAPTYNVQENILQFTCPTTTDNSSLAKVCIGAKNYELSPAYKSGNELVYLWDLREGRPDSVNLCNETLNFSFSGVVPAGKDLNIYSKLVDVRFQNTTLFDTLYLDVKKIDQMYKIQNPSIPLMDHIYITLKPEEFVANKEKTAVFSISPNNSYLYEGGTWNEKGEVSFRTKYFSYFLLKEDTIPPVIKFASKGGDGVKFIITDNLAGIKEFKAMINGKWLLMNYDHKRKLLWSSPLDKSVPLKGELILEVWDNTCNKSVFKTNL
jgi:hypothetical protein